MKAVEVIGEVDDRHCLHIALPSSVEPGKVRVIVPSHEPHEDEAGRAWIAGVSREWGEELTDSRQDIYTIDDGVRPSRHLR
jgi:hypothetical protein